MIHTCPSCNAEMSGGPPAATAQSHCQISTQPLLPTLPKPPPAGTNSGKGLAIFLAGISTIPLVFAFVGAIMV